MQHLILSLALSPCSTALLLHQMRYVFLNLRQRRWMINFNFTSGRMKRQMKNILTGSSILLLSVGMSIFFSGHAHCQSQSVFPSELQEEDRSERRWIKKQPPSNRKVKVFVDGQHAITIYPHQWHRDSSGNVYIRSDKTRRWIREED